MNQRQSDDGSTQKGKIKQGHGLQDEKRKGEKMGGGGKEQGGETRRDEEGRGHP